jgi:hypothetical protein
MGQLRYSRILAERPGHRTVADQISTKFCRSDVSTGLA